MLIRLPPARRQEFRRELRRSRHRLPRPRSQAGSEAYSQGLPLHTPLEQQESQWQAGGSEAAEVPPAGSPDRTASLTDDEQGSDGSGTASLAGMRAFVAQLQAKYGLRGAAEAAGDEGAPAPTTAGGLLGAAPAPAQRKPSLAQLLERELERQAAELGGDSEAEEDWGSARGKGQYAAAGEGGGAAGGAPPACPQLDGSDSEGGGHLGPAALRRVQRRQRRASAAAEGVATAGDGTEPAPSGSGPPQQALLARLAAAEAQLQRYSGLEAALERTQGEVQELRQQNGQLQTGGCRQGAGRHATCWHPIRLDQWHGASSAPPTHSPAVSRSTSGAELNEFVAHTGTLITSLQLQLSSFLSDGQGVSSGSATAADLAAAGRRPLPHPLSPASQAAAVPAAVVQARAAAEAVTIAQQAHAARSAGAAAAAPVEAAAKEETPAAPPAHAAAPAQAASPAWQDALADVQLPSFRSFARLQGLAAAAGGKPAAAPLGKPPAALPAATAPSLDPRWSVGWAVDGGSAENSPPEPRALPRGLQQWRPSGAAAAGAGGFEWRPMSAAG